MAYETANDYNAEMFRERNVSWQENYVDKYYRLMLGVYRQNLSSGLLQQHILVGLMAIFGVAVLLFIKPELE